MTVISKVVRNSAFNVFQPHDYSSNSKITISYDGKKILGQKPVEDGVVVQLI